MKRGLSFFLATFFNIGNIKFAPGTFGSLATLPLACILAYYHGFIGIIIGSIIAFFVGVFAVKEVLKVTSHDPSFVVIDEVAGQLLTFALVANHLQYNTGAWKIYLYGFILFRIFDIFKPYPVSWADKNILNAWGVMLDDIIAGIYAMIILYILFIFGIVI